MNKNICIPGVDELDKIIKGQIEQVKNIAKKYRFSVEQIDEIPGGYRLFCICKIDWDNSDKPSQEHVSNGIRLAQTLIKSFPEFDVSLETIDEWVKVNIQIKDSDG